MLENVILYRQTEKFLRWISKWRNMAFLLLKEIYLLGNAVFLEYNIQIMFSIHEWDVILKWMELYSNMTFKSCFEFIFVLVWVMSYGEWSSYGIQYSYHMEINPFMPEGYLDNEPSCCRWLNWPIQNHAKILKNHWNPGKWVLIWEYSVRAIKWVPTWQGLDDFRKTLHLCTLDRSSLSIGRVKCYLDLCYLWKHFQNKAWIYKNFFWLDGN